METGKNKLRIRRDALGVAALGTMVLALAGARLAPKTENAARNIYDAAKMELSQSDGGPKTIHYTPKQLAAMPGQKEPVRPGDGFDSLALRVNPGADLSTSGAKVDLRHYLRQQLETGTGRTELWMHHDSLCVPRVPHESPEPPIPPSARC